MGRPVRAWSWRWRPRRPEGACAAPPATVAADHGPIDPILPLLATLPSWRSRPPSQDAIGLDERRESCGQRGPRRAVEPGVAVGVVAAGQAAEDAAQVVLERLRIEVVSSERPEGGERTRLARVERSPGRRRAPPRGRAITDAGGRTRSVSGRAWRGVPGWR